jgi:hypothetical protein
VSQDDRMSLIERERIRRRVAAALEGEEYSVIEMAYDLERLATHPVWEQADCCASELEGAVTDLAAAVRLLNDAQTTIIDTDLRREWEAERARLRAAVEGSNP